MSSDEQQLSHFWFMTIEWRNADGTSGLGSYQGTRTPKRKETRLDAFNAIRADLNARHPRAKQGVVLVLAFDIQPNRL